MAVTISGLLTRRRATIVGGLAGVISLAAAWSPTTALAQGYPARPVQVIVTFAAGGGVDLTTRLVAEAAGQILGQRLVIENRGGAATVAGSAVVARAEPDGYTMLAAPTTMVINPAVRANLPFDWERDFVPVVLLAKLPFVVVASKDLPAGTMKELEAFGRQGPNPLTFGSGGTGTVAHLAGEFFGQRSGAKVQHVPYRGEAPALMDAIGGRISVMFSTLASASGHIEGGTMKALAVTTKERAGLLPDVPTVAEQGYPGYDLSAWVALVAPKGTSAEVVATLNRAFNEALRRPDLRERLSKLGAEPAGGSPEELARFMKNDAELWAKVIQDGNVTVEQ